MSKNHSLDEHKVSEQEEEASLLSRRAFLQASVKGAGATALGAAGLGAAVPASAVEGFVAPREDACEDTTTFVPIDPDTAVETWAEPWVWRPANWAGRELHLTVVENAAPVAITGTGFENLRPLLFSYGGITPGPTIRIRGDETLYLQLRNLLGLDNGETVVGPYPDPVTLPPGVSTGDIPQDAQADWCLGEHTNGVHAVHVTNLHTHGLHVRPGSNPDGTISDNIILRVMPQADFLAREDSPDPDCRFLLVNEQVGDATYEFRLGDIGASGAPHPPGTHWYHPHSHGATHNQVASGMAGFLIVEGDVDEAVNEQLAHDPHPDPETPTGPFNYRERLMFIQRVNPGTTASDPDEPSGVKREATFPTVNGSFQPKTIIMSPGAIERWRVLNGSVDGRGYIRFFVLKGEYTLCDNGDQLGAVGEDGTCTPLDTATIESLKQPLYQLSMDGVTLVRENGAGGYEHYVKALDFPAPPNPLDLKSTDTAQDRIDKISACYANADNARAAYNRPNELLLAPANRSDLFFEARSLQAGEEYAVYTLAAQFDILHNDNYEKGLRKTIEKDDISLPDWPGDTIVATLLVKGDPVPGAPIDVGALPPVPDYLVPVSDNDLRISTQEEAVARGTQVGTYRTRTVTYSGWGNADFPLINAHSSALDRHPDLLNVTYGPITPGSSQLVLLPPNIRTMAIDGLKFDPDGEEHPKMWLDSAEEWVVYNNSVTLWHNTSRSDWSGHLPAQAVTRDSARAQGLGLIGTTTVDHPFHIHVNPFWLIRHEVTLADGSLADILEEPRWQDVVWLPRNRGRAVLRSRFPDYLGEYVNHCHILLHEDNGMMQLVEVVPAAENSNFVPRLQVTQPGVSSSQVSSIYPRVTLNEAFDQNVTFVDPNPTTGQGYPGIDW